MGSSLPPFHFPCQWDRHEKRTGQIIMTSYTLSGDKTVLEPRLKGQKKPHSLTNLFMDSPTPFNERIYRINQSMSWRNGWHETILLSAKWWRWQILHMLSKRGRHGESDVRAEWEPPSLTATELPLRKAFNANLIVIPRKCTSVYTKHASRQDLYSKSTLSCFFTCWQLLYLNVLLVSPSRQSKLLISPVTIVLLIDWKDSAFCQTALVRPKCSISIWSKWTLNLSQVPFLSVQMPKC